jgi:hypothetical protein
MFDQCKGDRMLGRILSLMAIACLCACATDHKWAPDAELEKVAYVAGPPATLTLITSINGRSGSGAHSALLINGSQRVLYDPAGSWELGAGQAPERHDLHYGMFPGALDNYLAFQSAGVFYVVEQTITVPVAVADQAIADALQQGATQQAYCSHSVASVLRRVPGFENISVTFFPRALSREFAQIPGVVETRIEGTPRVDVKATN